MKKIAVILLIAVLILSFAAGCKKNDETLSPDSSVPATSGVTGEEEFKAPENYTSVILITINPVVKLYIDENNVVLAVECVNEDAKTAYSKIEKEIVGTNLESGVKKLINTASDAGYFEKEKKVTVDIVECKIEDNKKTVLSLTGSTVKQTLQESEIEASIEVKENGTDVDDETFKEVTMTEAEKKAEADKLAKEQADKEQAAKEQAAKEQAAKEQAEREAAQKLADAKNPQKSLKIGTRYIYAEKSELPEAEYLFIFITFNSNGEYGYGMGDYSTQNLYDDNDPIVYNGKNYYACSGLGGGGIFKTSDTKITLNEDEVEFELNENSELVITKSNNNSVLKVGQIFSSEK